MDRSFVIIGPVANFIICYTLHGVFFRFFVENRILHAFFSHAFWLHVRGIMQQRHRKLPFRILLSTILHLAKRSLQIECNLLGERQMAESVSDSSTRLGGRAPLISIQQRWSFNDV